MSPARWFFVLLLAAPLGARAQNENGVHAVAIRVNPPSVVRRFYDPGHPPPSVMTADPMEKGFCEFDFACAGGLGLYVDQKDEHTVEVTIVSVDVNLELPVTLWVPRNSPQKVFTHLEGHFLICAEYYKGCEEAARKVCESMVGRSQIGKGDTVKEAQQDAQDKLLAEIRESYWKETRAHCRAAQELYDQITDHGAALLPVKDAVAQAHAMERVGVKM